MSTEIIMIRHGFSVSNDMKFFTGQSDIELNPKGREQARLCGELFLKGTGRKSIWDMGIRDIDAIYSSDLSRAYETALEVGHALGLEVLKREELREIYAGKWEMMPFSEIDAEYSDEYAVWKNDIGRAVCTGGDSVKRLAERIERAVREIAEAHDGGAVVIVTHATPIRVICTLAEGKPSEEMACVPWVSNASLSLFDFDGAFHLIEKNITAHLGELKTDLPKGV